MIDQRDFEDDANVELHRDNMKDRVELGLEDAAVLKPTPSSIRRRHHKFTKSHVLDKKREYLLDSFLALDRWDEGTAGCVE